MASNPKKVVTGKVRASYVNVFQARHNDQSGSDEYSMMLIIDKDDRETVKKVERAIQAVLDEKFKGKLPRDARYPLRDADAEAEADGEDPRPELAGNFFMNVKSRQRPQVVDKNLDEVLDASEFQSGDYCRASLGAFGYSVNGNKGVSFGLNNVQVLAKGEPLGGRTRASDDFDAFDEDDEDDWNDVA